VPHTGGEGAFALRDRLDPAAATAPRRMQSPGGLAWLATWPTALVGILAIVVLGPPLGRALLSPPAVRFWSSVQAEVRPEPVEQGRYLVALAVPLLLVALTAAGARMRPRPASRWSDALVVAAQLALVGLAVACLARQGTSALYIPGEPSPDLIAYFTTRTLLVAAVGTLALAAAVRSARLRPTLRRLTRTTRARSAVAALVALAAIVVWLLHALYTEGTVAASFHDVWYHLLFTYDETYAVLDGRSPLVNYAAQYGSLLPYAFAAGMSVLGESLGVFVALALLATGLGMLAVYATLRRAARSAALGLLLFLPVLASSFFIVGGTLRERYTFADYYGTFPMRYAGPSLLVWLVARHLGGERPRRAGVLFLAAGLVLLNNGDAGAAALGATAAALAWGSERPLTRSTLARLALAAAAGLLAAFALVAALTLLRAGALPHVGLLFRFSSVFARAGFAMVPMPALGLHTIVYVTFVAALGVATVQRRRGGDRLLAGLLAWSGVFGLGAGAYFVGRSTPDDLIAVFFPWSLALALLTVPAIGALRERAWRQQAVGALACVFAFLVLACSLAQTPTPWEQLRRLSAQSSRHFTLPQVERFVAQHTRRGERVAILGPLGHRIAARLGIVNVSPYANSLAMPEVEQLDETVAVLRRSGGGKLFLNAPDTTPEMQQELEADGFAFETEDPRGPTVLWEDRARR